VGRCLAQKAHFFVSYATTQPVTFFFLRFYRAESPPSMTNSAPVT
jgi:hypothetical protein